MATLEQQIDSLADLNELREAAAKLRRDALYALTSGPYGDREKWTPTGDRIEQALVLRAILFAKRKSLKLGGSEEQVWNEVKALGTPSLRELYDDAGDHVPVMRAARVMQSLVATPGEVFSKASMVCYYRILRELYTADAPDWTTGGARAGSTGSPTAFVTGECARAVLDFARVLERTGELFATFQSIGNRLDFLETDDIPEAWQEIESQRLFLSIWITLARRAREVMPVLNVPDDASPAELVRLLTRLPTKLERVCRRDIRNIRAAIAECDAHRRRERRALTPTAYARSESAHSIARSILVDAADRAVRVQKRLRNDDENWQGLAHEFRDAAAKVRAVLRPARSFLEAVLDRELAATSHSTPVCDYPELAFALAAYGSIRGEWNDPRFERGARLLMNGIGEDGLYPLGRPLQVREKGYKLHVVGSEVARAVVQILRHVRVAVDPSFVRKLLRLFRETRAPGGGWTHERPEQPARSSWWTTALASIGLHRLVRMLDDRINHMVLEHFSTRRARDLTVDLDQLFYPDYGLSSHYPDEHTGIATLLQRMLAHLVGIPHTPWDSLWSVILYGPPGTGKTTIAEALARTANVTLVEITPSDIMVRGSEEAEGRARIVFNALSMLTDCVILFDEFEPVLQRRKQDGGTPESVFEFITPGMLPKLKKLHDVAGKQRVAYFLASNRIGGLDEAAIREGRFDWKVGVYPPDLLSRAGRLTERVLAHALETTGRDTTKACARVRRARARIAEVVQRTAKGPMNRLGRPGWFSASPKAGQPLAYAATGDGAAPNHQEPEQALPVAPVGTSRDALREWQQWSWVNEWDSQLNGKPTWNKLQRCLQSPPPALKSSP